MLPPEDYRQVRNRQTGDTEVYEDEMRRLYDRDERPHYDNGGAAERPARVGLVVLLVVLAAALAYGVWWVVTNDGLDEALGALSAMR